MSELSKEEIEAILGEKIEKIRPVDEFAARLKQAYNFKKEIMDYLDEAEQRGDLLGFYEKYNDAVDKAKKLNTLTADGVEMLETEVGALLKEIFVRKSN